MEFALTLSGQIPSEQELPLVANSALPDGPLLMVEVPVRFDVPGTVWY